MTLGEQNERLKGKNCALTLENNLLKEALPLEKVREIETTVARLTKTGSSGFEDSFKQ